MTSTNNTTRVALYERISQDPTGQELGVERHLADDRALAQQLGWTVVGEYVDNDISAYSGASRPEYERMLEDIEARELDAIITWHPDRLYRRMVDLGHLIEVVERHRCGIRTVKAGELDLTTATGRQTAKILAAVAEGEVELKAERQRSANHQKASAGKWTTRRRVFGYKFGGQEIEPAEAAAIRQAATDVLSGTSTGEIARRWTSAGFRTTGHGNTWRSRDVVPVLRRPLYACRVIYRGQQLGARGQWPQILDDETHLGLVAVLDGRRQPRPKTRKYQGTGVYRCGKCGDDIDQVLECSLDGSRGYKVYRCPRLHLSRKQEVLDDYVSDIVVARLSRDDAHLLIDSGKADVPGLRARWDALQARLVKLAGMFAAGDIDDAQLKAGSGQLRADQAEIDAQLAAQAQRDPVAELILAGDEIEKNWHAMSADRRGKIIDLLMTVTVLPAPLGQRRFDPEYVDIQWKKESCLG